MTNFNDMIKANAKTKAPAKSKATKTEIIPVPSDVQVEINALLKAKKEKKIAESNIAKAEPKILDFGIKLKDDNAYRGKFQKSYDIGNDEDHIKLVTANKWSFSEDDVDNIKGILGDKADEMILQETEVKLKPEVFRDADLQKKFVEMVGETFPEFFETITSHKVSEDFDQKVYTKGIDLEALRMFMKQSKPSLR